MRYKVTLYVGGKTFEETVIANNVNDAKETAKARNPTAKIISLTCLFKTLP